MDQPESSEMEDVLIFAQSLADAARPIALQYFRSALQIETKSDLSPVTIADRAIESEMRRLISARFPEHGIYGEEFSQHIGTEYTWVLDPIDGTRSFITGMPLFGCLIALMKGTEPMLGIIDIPALNERWLASKSTTTTLNGQVARTSGCQQLAQARLYTTSPDNFNARDAKCFDAISQHVAMRRFGGDCYIYGLLASGHCDLIIETDLKPFDYLALVPVIEKAGGIITDWQGQALNFHSDGRVIAAASEKLWQQAITFLNDER